MRNLSLLIGAALLVAAVPNAFAQDRYAGRPPVMVSPDLAAPWVMQLENSPHAPARHTLREIRAPRGVTVGVSTEQQRPVANQRRASRNWIFGGQPMAARDHSARQARAPREMDPRFLPQTVAYQGPHKAGTIVIDTSSRYLYLVEAGGQARRYGVGVGKEGMAWSGTQRVSNKRVWPDWRPPSQMIARERAKGRDLPSFMEGGPANPLGARALYLGSTLYRIHGTNAPWTIGTAQSSGCIRMRNEDVVDLYDRVHVGTKVVVL